jgi:hypothetical protein
MSPNSGTLPSQTHSRQSTTFWIYFLTNYPALKSMQFMIYMAIKCKIMYKSKKVVDFLLCVREGRVSEWSSGGLFKDTKQNGHTSPMPLGGMSALGTDRTEYFPGISSCI